VTAVMFSHLSEQLNMTFDPEPVLIARISAPDQNLIRRGKGRVDALTRQCDRCHGPATLPAAPEE